MANKQRFKKSAATELTVNGVSVSFAAYPTAKTRLSLEARERIILLGGPVGHLSSMISSSWLSHSHGSLV